MNLNGILQLPTYKRERRRLVNTLIRFFEVKDRSALQYLLSDLRNLNAYLCGGAITSIFSNSRVNDLDFYLYSTSVEYFRLFKELMTKHHFKCEVESDTAFTYSRRVGRGKRVIQLVKAFQGSSEEIYETFDFTVCCGSYNFSDNQFELHERFLPDIAARRLVYLGVSRFPICAMYRTLKYTRKGYTLSGATVMHIALCISQLEIETYGDLKKHLAGIDTQFLGGYLDKHPADETVEVGEFIQQALEALEGSIDVALGVSDGSSAEEFTDELRNLPPIPD